MALRDVPVNQQKVVLCKFATILAGMDDDDIDVLKEWVKERGFGSPRIKRGLAEGGFNDIGQDTISRHLTACCGCLNAPDPVLYGVRQSARM